MISSKNIDSTNDIDSNICPICGYYIFNITTHDDCTVFHERYTCSNCDYTITLFLNDDTVDFGTTIVKRKHEHTNTECCK